MVTKGIVATLSALGGTIGGVVASLQVGHPTVEAVGTGALGGGAISLVAWGIMQSTVAAHTEKIKTLETTKADEKLMTAHLTPMQESLERLHTSVAEMHRDLTALSRRSGSGR